MIIDWTHFTPWSSLAGGLLIGLATALLLLLSGRIAGISGIVGGLLRPSKGDVVWRVAFVLGLFAAPSLTSTLGNTSSAHFTPRLALELVLMTLLFSSLVCSAMAARYYNHAGFICAMPVNSQARQRWAPIGAVYLRRAGYLYSWGLRNLLMVAPILAFIVYPWAGPAAAVIVIAALVAFDRFVMK